MTATATAETAWNRMNRIEQDDGDGMEQDGAG